MTLHWQDPRVRILALPGAWLDAPSEPRPSRGPVLPVGYVSAPHPSGTPPRGTWGFFVPLLLNVPVSHWPWPQEAGSVCSALHAARQADR